MNVSEVRDSFTLCPELINNSSAVKTVCDDVRRRWLSVALMLLIKNSRATFASCDIYQLLTACPRRPRRVAVIPPAHVSLADTFVNYQFLWAANCAAQRDHRFIMRHLCTAARRCRLSAVDYTRISSIVDSEENYIIFLYMTPIRQWDKTPEVIYWFWQLNQFVSWINILCQQQCKSATAALVFWCLCTCDLRLLPFT